MMTSTSPTPTPTPRTPPPQATGRASSAEGGPSGPPPTPRPRRQQQQQHRVSRKRKAEPYSEVREPPSVRAAGVAPSGNGQQDYDLFPSRPVALRAAFDSLTANLLQLAQDVAELSSLDTGSIAGLLSVFGDSVPCVGVYVAQAEAAGRTFDEQAQSVMTALAARHARVKELHDEVEEIQSKVAAMVRVCSHV